MKKRINNKNNIVFDRRILEGVDVSRPSRGNPKPPVKVTRPSIWRILLWCVLGLLALGFLRKVYLAVDRFCEVAFVRNPISPAEEMALFLFVVVCLVLLFLRLLRELGF